MPLFVFIVVLMAAVLHAVWNLAVKRVSGHMGMVWLGLWIGAVASAAFAAAQRIPLQAGMEGWVLLLATGIIHAIYFILLAKAYETGDISIVYPVARGTGVVVMAIMAWLILRERISTRGWSGIACIAGGILTLSGKGLDIRALWRDLGMAIVVGLTISSFSIIDSRATRHFHPCYLIAGIFGISAALLTPWMLRRRRAMIATAWREMKTPVLIFGLGSAINYGMVLYAYGFAPAAYVGALREFSVVAGAVFGVWLLKEPWSARKSAGIVAIVAGLVLIRFA